MLHFYNPPDLFDFQEALEGVDLLGELGYSKLASSASKAPLAPRGPLRRRERLGSGASRGARELPGERALCEPELRLERRGAPWRSKGPLFAGGAWKTRGKGMEKGRFWVRNGRALSELPRTGVEQISSGTLGDLCLAPRSVVWAKPAHPVGLESCDLLARRALNASKSIEMHGNAMLFT